MQVGWVLQSIHPPPSEEEPDIERRPQRHKSPRTKTLLSKDRTGPAISTTCLTSPAKNPLTQCQNIMKGRTSEISYSIENHKPLDNIIVHAIFVILQSQVMWLYIGRGDFVETQSQQNDKHDKDDLANKEEIIKDVF